MTFCTFVGVNQREQPRMPERFGLLADSPPLTRMSIQLGFVDHGHGPNLLSSIWQFSKTDEPATLLLRSRFGGNGSGASNRKDGLGDCWTIVGGGQRRAAFRCDML